MYILCNHHVIYNMYDVYNIIHISCCYKNSLALDTYRRFTTNIGILVHFGFERCEIMQQFLLNIYYKL